MTGCQSWAAWRSSALTGCKRSEVRGRGCGCTRGYCPCTERGCIRCGCPCREEGCRRRAGVPGNPASLRLCWSPPPRAEAVVTGAYPARGRRPCQGESTVYVDSDDEYDDAAGSSIASSSVDKSCGRGRKIMCQSQVKVYL